MPSKFHFFTDIDLIQLQSEAEAFGEITAGHEDYVYNLDAWCVSSMHTASADPLAYAICNGEILVQEDTTSGGILVNIILKPTEQPRKSGVNLPEVKYYIYRGIKKSSIISGELVVYPSVSSLTHEINTDTANSAPSYITGINRSMGPIFDDSSSLDNLFYEPTGSSADPTGLFQKFPVKGGQSLGVFDSVSFGFEIMLNRSHLKAVCGDVRKHKHLLIVDAVGTGTYFEMTHRMQKEQLINYLDPAAFYGAFQDKAILWARKSTDAVTNFDYNFKKIKAGDVYKEILEGDVSGVLRNIFYNRNNVYLDIQNELGYSYNQMQNYGDDLIIAINKDFDTPLPLDPSVANVNYYDRGSGVKWPILKLPANLTNFPENKSSTVRVAMPVGDNFKPLFYVSVGDAAKSSSIKSRVGKSNFFTPVYNKAFNTEFAVEVPTSKISGTNYAVAGYVQVRYFKRIKPGDITLRSNDIVLRQQLYLDHLFNLKDLKNPYSDDERVTLFVYDDLAYIDMEDYNGSDFVGKLGIARDHLNTTLFVTGTERRNTKKSHEISTGLTGIYSDKLPHFGDFLNYVDEKEPAVELERYPAPVLVPPFPTWQITRFKPHGKGLNKQIDKVFVSVIIPNILYDNLPTVAEDNDLDPNLPIYLCFGDGFVQQMNDFITKDIAGFEYLNFPLHLIGYINNSGSLEVKRTTTSLTGPDPTDPQITIYGYKF